MSDAPVFQTRGLKAGYSSESVLNGVDWILEQGDSFAVVGPSGSGKTLFFKALVGLVPYQGSVRFAGYEVNALTAQRRQAFREAVGMTFQKDGLFDSLSCADNLRFPLNERLKLGSKEREKRVAQALEQVGLSGQGNLMVHEMSGGMQKRLGIARALLFSPRVILYDEPAAGLDPITTRSINDLICEMQQRHSMTVVLITSDLTQAQQVCKRMGMLWKGRFESQGTWEALHRSDNAAVRQFFGALPDGPLTEMAL